MSVSEIRSAFIANNAVREQIRNFRIERLAAIKLNEGAIPLLDSGVQLVLHVIPVSSFGDHILSTDVLDSQKFNLRNFNATNGDCRFNLDGVYRFAQWQTFELPIAYTQLFRNGRIESVNAAMMRLNTDSDIAISVVESELCKRAFNFIAVLRNCGIAPPIILAPALLGVKGRVVIEAAHGMRFGPIQKNDLVLPETLLETYPTNVADVAKIMRSALDAMWNAAGHIGSKHFNTTGDWIDPVPR
ncbi:hypothetical protein [Paenibacillus sp. IHBB 3054]|uniref:hypothetical protein n=1 Tax=Paenibacillus sp. IHBB 3054 TaxID=3425689 RepID=UPI003F66F2EA